MAESAEHKAPVNEADARAAPDGAGGDGPHDSTPPTWLPPDPADAMLRFRRAAPWIIAAFGLMGAVLLLVVPFAVISDVEPTSRRTIVLASIIAFIGVAVAIIGIAAALAPRSVFIEQLEPRRHRITRHFSAHRAVEDAFARQPDTEAVEMVSPEIKQRLVRFEKERNAIRLGFAGVMVGAIAIGTAAGVMVWEFENPTTAFEVDRIHADTVRIQAETQRIYAETRRLESEIAQIDVAILLDEGELATQTQKIELELDLLQETIMRTRADSNRLQSEADAAPLVEVIVGQIADVELAIEAMLQQLIVLNAEIDNYQHAIAG